MKKYLIVGLLFLPLFAKAQTAPLANNVPTGLIGFSDGNMYDPVSGIWKCLFLMDNNCYDVAQNILTTRPAPADVSTVVSGNNTFTFPTNPLEPTPQPVPVSPPSPFIPNPQPIPQPSPVLLPAYTQDQLLQKFYDDAPVSPINGGKMSLTYDRYWPVTVQVADTSASFNFQGYYGSYKDVQVVFNGQVVLNVPVDGGNSVAVPVLNLAPNTDYTYQVVYKEAGRQDSIFSKSFHTLK